MSGPVLLAIDDKPDNLFVIEHLVGAYLPECTVIKAGSASEGLAIIGKGLPDGMLVDVQMPGMSGIELCRLLKSDTATNAIPIILVTAHKTSSEQRVQGLEAGADDFISKPIDNAELIAKIKVMLRTKQSEDNLRQRGKQLEEAVAEKTVELQKVEDRYKTLFDSASDAIFIHDLEGHFLEVNWEACKRLGYSYEELLSMSVKDLDNSEDAKKIQQKLARLQKQNHLFCETVHVTQDGTSIPTELNIRLIDFDGKKCALSIARNISDRKQAEAEKEKLETQLHQAQKMEAIGTLAGGIAHDFNNILAVIIGYTEMALCEAGLASDAQHSMEQVLQAGHRAKDLVKHILTFSRRTQLERKPVQINSIVKEALKFLRASIPSTIEIRQNIRADSGFILADPTQIHQILMNLCTNAHHAMREKGGILNIELVPAEVTQGEISLYHGLKPGSFVKLTVSDTGTGMDKKTMERIFDPYFTTKNVGEGSGLGLAVAHGIVKSHRGTIKVESEQGVGTTFHIFFPRIEERENIAAKISEQLPLGHERILLIDDEKALIDLGKRMLERLGYQVEAKLSPIDALGIFESDPHRFDLVITDMTMPQMTGEMLAGKLMSIRPDLPVILCTGYSEQISEEKAHAIGIKDLLMKPLIMIDLAKAVRTTLDEG